MAEAGERTDLAALLRVLKERSGLSYGVLAKRLHMSPSTLHRYCNGDAVPADYAPVERLARLCRATPEELAELHRRWLLADAARLRDKRAATGADRPSAAPPPAVRPEAAVQDAQGAGGEHAERGSTAGGNAGPGARPEGEEERPVPAAPGPAGSTRSVRRRRTVWLSAMATAAVLASAALALALPGEESRRQEPPSTASADGPAARRTPHLGGSRSPSPTAPRTTGRPSASVSASTAPGGTAPSAPDGARRAAPEAPRDAVPLTVAARPYAWDHPCTEHYLVDRPPGQVPPPPPTEQEAPGWVNALGAVSTDDHLVELTVQGTGAETVVLQDLHVRVVERGAPLAWNAYAMGIGCGGDVPTKSFDVDLDKGTPEAVPVAGQRDFPYSVTETDPLVLYVTGHTAAHDVTWFLELEWSSGDRRGTLRVDTGGPLRTAAVEGRPLYGYPLGGDGWLPQTG
ncbi:helix-turn-helix domain-containing protein [Streptomyces sp. TRM 70361]|uniref:transcriptional regulator n=1 Tax=Streptomyces sp. TRM 70361 TaxID=3116553 RepID=UPI002E7C011A|nr:helix-turn-helix domain-containing protein [Streptomyces sp. TRM 70361]MEE1940487.1 helix-turn-helix domain-containing protein [Streptomyces sp. TRM 70361]